MDNRVDHPGFFERSGPYSVAKIAEATGANAASGHDPDLMINDVLPLSNAQKGQMTFLDNRKYLSQLSSTSASVCLIKPAWQDKVPVETIALVTKEPYHGFARALQLFYPEAMRSKCAGFAVDHNADRAASAVHSSASIATDATIAADAIIEPGAVIGKEAVIGSGSVIAAGAVIGYRVHIGAQSFIGPCASVIHAIIGDNVVVHGGVRIGQDGFGFAMGAQGHIKVPQIGRVVIHDHVEIGANSCIDRGALNDTVIGEGTKIDDLVMIGHNAVLGRNCIIVAKCGISGSSTLGDFVVMGADAGISGHVNVGAGAQIAGTCHVIADVEAGARMGGTPARPFKEWARELAAIKKLAVPKQR